MRLLCKLLLVIIVIISFSCGRDDKEISALIEEAENKLTNTEDKSEDNNNVDNNEYGKGESSNENNDSNLDNKQSDDTNNDALPNDDSENPDNPSSDGNSKDNSNTEGNDTKTGTANDNNQNKDSEEENANTGNLDYNNYNDSIVPSNEEEKPNIPELNNLPDISFSIKTFATNNQFHQSAACYGDYAFFISNYHTEFHMYNLRTRKRLYDLQYPKGTGKDFLGQTLYHCNQATFGMDFFDSSDPFPILYISQHAKEDKRYFVEGYRILPVWNNEENEYDSFNVELVQTIFFPPMTNRNALGTINMVIDPETNKMYTYSRNNNLGFSNSNRCIISCFEIPSSYKKDIYLEDTDILWSFYPGCIASNMQGGCVNNGILYIAQGVKSAGYIYLNIIDLQSRQQIGRLNFLNHGYTWEPEGCFFYDGHVMLGGGNNIYQIIIE